MTLFEPHWRQVMIDTNDLQRLANLTTSSTMPTLVSPYLGRDLIVSYSRTILRQG